MKNFVPRSLAFAGILALSSVAKSTAAETAPRRVVFLGDSITAAYGVDPVQGYVSLIQKKIDAQGWNVRAINAGVSGDTTAGGVRRLDWSLKDGADVLVIALGGNDGLRGVDPATIKSNLQAIVDGSKKRAPAADLILCGMMMPPNYGGDYTRRYAAVFTDLARANRLTLVPFFLKGVGGIDQMNQPDRIHPTPAGHALIADTVWSHLEPLLRRRLTSSP